MAAALPLERRERDSRYSSPASRFDFEVMMHGTAINLVNQQEMLQPDGSSIVLVHFAHRGEDGRSWKIACVPNLEEKDMAANDKCPHPWKRSDDPRAVTCPVCKESVPYKSVNALLCATAGRR